MAGVSGSKTSDLNYEARVPKKSKIRLMIYVDFCSFLSKDIDSILRSAADPPDWSRRDGSWLLNDDLQNPFDDLC